jgi:hypothetical protein
MANKQRILKSVPLLLLLLTCSPLVRAEAIKLAPDHPDRYVVIKGDTLWDIAARFLQDPWQWPEIWYINPAIENPHLIYPGDVIRLEFVNGKPVLKLDRPAPGPEMPTVKLSPAARLTPLETAIPTIPPDAIAQFLKYPRIVSEKDLEESGYLLASAEDHLISATGSKVYARGIRNQALGHYQIVRKGRVYHRVEHPGEVLGNEAIIVGEASLVREGDPATLVIDRADREALMGDRVLPAIQEEINQYFTPRAPGSEIKGRILSVMDGLTRIGQYQVVAIDRGSRDGLQAGDVLAVYQAGEIVRDRVGSRKMRGEPLKLPDERAGTIMVIRPFDRISYALVMEAARDLRVMDVATTP